MTYPLFPKDEESRKIFPELDDTPDIDEKVSLVFAGAGEKIRIGCYFGEFRVITFDLGIVPHNIASKGTIAIKDFANTKMQKLIRKERKRRRSFEKRILELHREYTLVYNETTIRGFVEKGEDHGAHDDRMNLTMTAPFQRTLSIQVRPQCFADAMHGTQSFDDDGNLLDQEISRQKKKLISMYKKELHRRQKPPEHPALAALRSLVDD